MKDEKYNPAKIILAIAGKPIEVFAEITEIKYNEKQSKCFVSKASDINFEEVFSYNSKTPFHEVLTMLEDKYGEEEFVIDFDKNTHNLLVTVYDYYLE